VPRGRGGVRFTITNALEFADIDALLTTMSRLLPLCLEDAGSNRGEADEAFGRIRARLNLELAA
jgi:hypothetical protein